MTIEEFRELYKNAKDISALVNSHVEVANMNACFEYNGKYIRHEFSKAFIDVKDENTILIYAKEPIELKANADGSKIDVFITFDITAKTNIYDILTGKQVKAELVKSDISLDSSSNKIVWENLENYTPDLSCILYDGWKDNLIKKLSNVLVYDVFKGREKNSSRKTVYDFILKYIETKYNTTEEDNTTKEMILEAYKADECQDLLCNFDEWDLYRWIDDLYSAYKDQVNQEEFNACASQIVSNYYDGFYFSEIANYTNLRDYYSNDTENDVLVTFKFI